MKKLIFSLFALFLTICAFAQKVTTAQEATNELVKVYGLDNDQAQDMLVIQERKVRNLNDIQSLKTSDEKKYRHKIRAIKQSTDASIRRVLNDEQMAIYQKRRSEWRVNRSKKIAALKESGMTMDEIEGKLLEAGY